jgi:hypothetical protein
MEKTPEDVNRIFRETCQTMATTYGLNDEQIAEEMREVVQFGRIQAQKNMHLTRIFKVSKWAAFLSLIPSSIFLFNGTLVESTFQVSFFSFSIAMSCVCPVAQRFSHKVTTAYNNNVDQIEQLLLQQRQSQPEELHVVETTPLLPNREEQGLDQRTYHTTGRGFFTSPEHSSAQEDGEQEPFGYSPNP